MIKLLNTITSVFVGLMMAATNFAPIVGWQRFVDNKRRVANAMLLFAGSFLLLGAAIF